MLISMSKTHYFFTGIDLSSWMSFTQALWALQAAAMKLNHIHLTQQRFHSNFSSSWAMWVEDQGHPWRTSLGIFLNHVLAIDIWEVHPLTIMPFEFIRTIQIKCYVYYWKCETEKRQHKSFPRKMECHSILCVPNVCF